MSYFKNIDLRAKLLQNVDDVLRVCQHGATLATVAHFTSSDAPAIISLPTGAGKTELMFSIAFAHHASRILIIEPSLFLRRQTADKLKRLDVFRAAQLITGDENPNVKQAWKSMGTEADWLDLKQYDAVVSTPKTISPEEKHVTKPPDDLFDFIFIDEAHHASAKTWRAILAAFPEAKKVLLTATAFRRDRRKIPGKLIYHYPVGRALIDQIYRSIEFMPVPRGELKELDRDIAKAAILKLTEEREKNPDAGLLIRTDLINKCSDIAQIYSDLGIETVVIHSELGKQEADKRITKLRDGQINAAVIVGMMAEGIDIPRLKIAALHSPPRSLPYTLQIVGRVSRNDPNQSGSAWLVAVPSEIHGEARKLFREDRAWREIVPDLIDDAIKHAHGERAQAILDNCDTSTIVPEDLTPFFSVGVHQFKEPNGRIHDERLPLDLNDVKGLPHVVESIEALASAYDNCTSIITMSSLRPTWGRESELYDSIHDLHIMYSPEGSRLIFLATTSIKILKVLAEALIDETELVDPRNLHGALQEAQMTDYSSVGLENALGLTGLHPIYKMHLGSGSGTSIRPSEGLIFGAGHVVGKLRNSTEIRGTATKRRRIWAMRRESLGEFIGWCTEIANQVTTPVDSLPGLNFLAKPLPAKDIFITDPIGVVASDAQFSLPISTLVCTDGGILRAELDPIYTDIERVDYTLKCELHFRSDEKSISLVYNADKTGDHWSVIDDRTFEIIDPETNDRRSLEVFLNDYPPIILMANGGAIRGDYGWLIMDEGIDLPDEMFKGFAWRADTDVRHESLPGRNGMKNVQEKTIEFLQADLENDTILVVDDAAYEIADIIAVSPVEKKIRFVHVKYAGADDPRNEVSDWYELFGQAARSHSWIRKPSLLKTIDERIDRRQNTKIVSTKGSRADLQKLALDYKTNDWEYEVLTVQPGCSISKVMKQKDSHVYKGLASIREWLNQTGASFRVWGSE